MTSQCTFQDIVEKCKYRTTKGNCTNQNSQHCQRCDGSLKVEICGGALMPAPVDADKLNEYLSDMIGFLARQESASYEPEDQTKYRYARNALEDMQKKVDEGVFK